MLTPEIFVESELWTAEPAAEEAVARAIAAAADRMILPKNAEGPTIVLTDNETIRALNRDWRGHDKPTNVLSFPAPAPAADGQPHLLGDIAIAYETVAHEAADEGKPFAHHLSHLTIHGFLHLLGYDHETDREAEAMEALETSILGTLNIPDPYAARAEAGGTV